MTLATRMGLGDRGLVALVGGGGKSTLLFRLGTELASDGRRVVMTTTTKMGRDQIDAVPNVCDSIQCVLAEQVRPGPIMLVVGGDSHKITGPAPEELDALAREPSIDFVIVEADGAHGRPLKAPGPHEPVIPSTSTTVVIAMGIDAVGQRLDEVSHRVERAMEFTGHPADRILTAEDCSVVLTHPNGALREVPDGARVVVALTKVAGAVAQSAAGRMRSVLAGYPAIHDVITIRGR